MSNNYTDSPYYIGTNQTIELDPDFGSNSTGHTKSCNEFQFYINTVVVGAFCILGLIGNTVSIRILQRDRHNRVAVFLLQALAVADNSVLILSFVCLTVVYGLLESIDHPTFDRAIPYMIKYVNPVAMATQSCVIWITVLLAVNRYAAICRPFDAKRWLKMSGARLQVLVVVVVSFVLNAPRGFIIDLTGEVEGSNLNSTENQTVTGSPHRGYKYTSLGKNRMFEVIYLNVLYTSLVLALPLVLLVGFNVPLIRQLQRSKRQMISNSLVYDGKQEDNITLVMIVIIVQLVVFHTPDRVCSFVRFYLEDYTTTDCPHPLYYTMNCANLLVILNSTTDFIVYYIFRKRFRKILYQKLTYCCCCCGAVSKKFLRPLSSICESPTVVGSGKSTQTTSVERNKNGSGKSPRKTSSERNGNGLNSPRRTSSEQGKNGSITSRTPSVEKDSRKSIVDTKSKARHTSSVKPLIKNVETNM